MLEEVRGNRNPYSLLLGMQIGVDTLKIGVKNPQNTKNKYTI